MTETDVTEKPGRGGARGPRTFKETPTARDRVISESLAKKVKELTGLDVTPQDARAVKFSLSRWYEDPETKELLNNMDSQLKRAKAQEKKEKAEADLKAAMAELEGVDDEFDDDEGDDEDATAEAAADDDSDEEADDDVFEDGKVSASF